MKDIDVSVHNGTFDWQKVWDTGNEFAILRAGYGRFAKYKAAHYVRLLTTIHFVRRRHTPVGCFSISIKRGIFCQNEHFKNVNYPLV